MDLGGCGSSPNKGPSEGIWSLAYGQCDFTEHTSKKRNTAGLWGCKERARHLGWLGVVVRNSRGHCKNGGASVGVGVACGVKGRGKVFPN